MNPGIKPTQESPISPQKKHTCLCGILGTRVLSQALRPAHLGRATAWQMERGRCLPAPGDVRQGPTVTELESWELGEP